MKKIAQILVLIIFAAAMAFSLMSCGNDASSAQTTGLEENVQEENKRITITVTVVDDKGESQDFHITANADNLGDALVDEGLAEGEKGAYGLYITSVNGLSANYDENKAYWAIYKDGEYLMTGADSTAIADGDHYELIYTKE